jgi:hypothetical protein
MPGEKEEKVASVSSTDIASKSPVLPIQVDRALTSLRSSGHDPCSAVGEVIDNSLEANANNIGILTFDDRKVTGKTSKRVNVIERVAVGDDGDGMTPEVLRQALSLGFSTRFNSRKGMGRFGVGAKLGAISQVKRVDMWSRATGEDPWLWTYIDLDEIADHEMEFLPEPAPKELPDDCRKLVGDVGTLVIWSKCDRLQQRDSGGARSADAVRSDLTHYVGRTFRKFLDAGRRICIEGVSVKPHDPLFLMTTTMFHQGPDPDPLAEIIVSDSFDWRIPSEPDRTSKVYVTVTLLPEKFRPERGAGGSRAARDRYINDHEQEGFSILRADREIFAGILQNVQPSPVLDIDRWIGKEIRFSPELDECFAVRNVKKGAEPIDGLRDKLREYFHKTIEELRKKRIQIYWIQSEEKQRAEKGVHTEAEQVAARAVKLTPRPVAGRQVPEQEKTQRVHKAAETLVPSGQQTPAVIEAMEAEIKNLPLKIVPQEFPGNEFIEVDHLGDTALVRVNTRHAFYQQVYNKLVAAVEKQEDVGEAGVATAKLAQMGIDLLLLAYARAEGMDPNPGEKYSDLRTYWGINLKAMINEWVKG